jgi:tetratricopeptide (TPR) repeat protein
MKAKNRRQKTRDSAALAAAQPAFAPLLWKLAALAVVTIAFWAYSPAAHGPFVFDDNYLPFSGSNIASAPLMGWIRGVRPVLMFTYWVNARISGADPWSYHVFNVLIHLLAGGLVFLIVRRLAEWANIAADRRPLLSAFAAAVFLLHPIQTEAVAYLAGRSECLSATLFLAAFAVFLYRPKAAATWLTVAAVLALFGAAVLAKEHTIVLPALLLLTDYWWNPGFKLQGILRNWKLYTPMAAGALAGFAMFWNLIMHAGTAGFALKDFTWYQYFYTEWRALFVYVAEFLLPVRLTADWDFPVSRTPFDHGAVFGLIALISLAAAAWHWRRRFPLATYGFFVFLLLMAPTSSILPIADPVAERRIYFSMIGLLLILVDALGRLNIDHRGLAAGCAVVALLAAGATYARAAVWADPLALWMDDVRKAPDNARAHFNLAFAWYSEGHPELAIPEFEATARLQPPNADLLLDWGLAYDQMSQPDKALAKLRESAALNPTAHVWTQIGMVYGKMARWPEALDALATARKMDASFPYTYLNLGKVHMLMNQVPAAVEDYRRALALDPAMEDARHDLAIAEARLRAAK